MIPTRLSQGFALALALVLFVFMITAPGVGVTEFAGTIYAVFAVVVVVLFTVLFFVLRFATIGLTVFWGGTRPPNRQVLWLFITIGTALSIQMSVGWVLEFQGLLNTTTSTAIGLLVWTLMPAAFLVSGRVEWPRRLAHASGRRLFLIGVVALSCATAVSYAKFAAAPDDFTLPPRALLLVTLVLTLIMAAAEEVMMRVLLLTALLDLTRSRFNAVFLSSAVFALVHGPLELSQPIMHADWALLQFAAHAYAPTFLMQMLAGLALGVIWLRTGSISIVAVTHAIINVGPAWLQPQ